MLFPWIRVNPWNFTFHDYSNSISIYDTRDFQNEIRILKEQKRNEESKNRKKNRKKTEKEKKKVLKKAHQKDLEGCKNMQE